MNDLTGLQPVIEANLGALLEPGVLAVRPGYRTDPAGRLSTEKAIVVVVDPSLPAPRLPTEAGGFPVDVRVADEVERLRAERPDSYARIASARPELEVPALGESGPVAGALSEELLQQLAAKPQLPYTKPADADLGPVEGRISITCHASPDAGWPQLSAFLAATRERLTIGLYDFTAKHILDQLQADLAGPQVLTVTLDNPPRNPSADQTDGQTLEALRAQMGDSLAAAWALNRMNRSVQRWVFPSAYHIKVAVRDGAAVWLSSGNWNNSNQPDFDPLDAPAPDDQTTARNSDRDWHVTIENAQLAGMFEAYLKHDYEVARAEAQSGGAPRVLAAQEELEVPIAFGAAPAADFEFVRPKRLDERMRIRPLLTPDPDVYVDAMLELVNSAERYLYIQLQYIHPSDKDGDERFIDLVDALVGKIGNERVDVRIIVSQWQTTNGWLDRLQATGVDLGVVKIQNRVHNKGFVVDDRVVVLGSQNWSGDGVLRNRDASVMIESPAAAAYYKRLFEHDWERLARPAGTGGR